MSRTLLFLFGLTIGFLLDSSTAACFGNISVSEYNALKAVFDALDGSNWKWNRKLPTSTIWKFPCPFAAPCANHWQGLNCSSTNKICGIESVALSDFNLKGSLPSDIANLKTVQFLGLNFNKISGTIPNEIYSLNNLKYLDFSFNNLFDTLSLSIGTMSSLLNLNLSNNQLFGTISTTIGNLSSLQVLDLTFNQFSGSLPSSLSQLTACQILDLSRNNIGGRLSSSEVEQMPSLTQLRLGFNHFTGPLPVKFGMLETLSLPGNSLSHSVPTEIGQLTTLVELSISSNNLRGSIPTEIGLLTALVRLEFDSNMISGTLPTEVGRLESVSVLTASSNNMTGRIPTEIGQMTALVGLNLDENFLTGSIPTSIGMLSVLQRVHMFKNQLEGSICSEIGELTALVELNLYGNCLTGSIPTSIGKLSMLRELNLFDNQLEGSICSEIGGLTALVELNLYDNGITGSLPTEIGQLTDLISLGIGHNTFSGSLPTQLGRLILMKALDLSYNQIEGTIPSQIGNMMSLLSLNCETNWLTGTLPTEIGQLTEIIGIFFMSNYLNGTLPTEIGELSLLFDLDFYNNSMSGSLPTEIGQLKSLNYLYLFQNSFTGPLPSQIGYLTSLQFLDCNFNYFSGAIPTEISQLTALLLFFLTNNRFSGTIPTEIMQMTSLSVLDLNNNMFSGSLSSEISQMVSLTQLNLLDNRLSGCLPSQLGQMNAIIDLVLSENLFSASVPSEIFALRTLKNLDFSNNILSSELPQTFYNTTALNSFDASMNMLYGSIPIVSSLLKSFNVSFNQFAGDLSLLFSRPLALVELEYLDVSHNLLTGALTVNLDAFMLPHLQTLMLNSNCFSGTISPNLTHITSLQNLILDAYGSAPGCDVKIPNWLSWLVKGLFLKSANAVGSLPVEVVQMPSLLTLHAAGNALTGTLPDLRADSKLIDVSLANNYLQGTIPLSWQTHSKFLQVDLSFNKLSGTLSSNLSFHDSNISFVSLNGTHLSAVFDLSVNRLSGKIPRSLYSSQGVNILDGNLFQCQEHDMPQSDPNKDTYVCGSNALNVALYVWLGVCFATIALGWYILRAVNSLSYHCDMQSTPRLRLFLQVINETTQMFSLLAIAGVVVLMTAYVVMKSIGSASFSTHSEQYGWITTVTFLQGVFPTVLALVMVLLACATVSLRFMHILATVPDDYERKRWRYGMVVKVCLVLVWHFLVTVFVNVLYVVIVLVGLPESELTVFQFALGGFKLLWNRVYINWCLTRLPFLSASARLQLTSAMKIITFLVSPYVATFFSDSTCFKYVITGTPVISASFLARSYSCLEDCYGSDCHSSYICYFSESVINTSTFPPWLYSYQCSSALLTNYVPVLVASYLVSGLILPSVALSYALLSDKTIETWIPTFICDRMLNGTLYERRNVKSSSGEPAVSSDVTGNNLLARVNSKPIFQSNRIISKLVMNMAVMLTFGFATPLLGVIVATDTFTNVFVLNLVINRYVEMNLTPEGSLKADCASRLESAANDCSAGLFSSWQLSMVSVAFFWALFEFDMIGDVYGPRSAVVGDIVLTLCLLTIVVSPIVYTELTSIWPRVIRATKSFGVELQTSTSSMTEFDLNSDFSSDVRFSLNRPSGIREPLRRSECA